MHKNTTRQLWKRTWQTAAIGTAAAMLVTACGGSDSGVGERVGDDSPLAGCPKKIVIQAGWFPEAEHSPAYMLAGPDGKIDAKAGTYTGSIDGTGVDVEIRTGGTYIGFQQTASIMYQKPEVFIALAGTTSTIDTYATTPTVSVFAPFIKPLKAFVYDPSKISIDPKNPASVKASGAPILVEEANKDTMTFLADRGMIDLKQADYSYDGALTRYVTEDGKSMLFGYQTNEPYRLENLTPGWDRPVKAINLGDVGYETYDEIWAVRPEAITEYKQCLSALIPMAQKAQLEYLKNPGPLNKSIEELVKAEKTFWEVDQPSMQYAVDVMNNDGLVGNGPSGTYGEFDKDRINRLIKEYGPVMEKSGRKVPDVTADDLVTNEFLDPTVKFTK